MVIPRRGASMLGRGREMFRPLSQGGKCPVRQLVSRQRDLRRRRRTKPHPRSPEFRGGTCSQPRNTDDVNTCFQGSTHTTFFPFRRRVCDAVT